MIGTHPRLVSAALAVLLFGLTPGHGGPRPVAPETPLQRGDRLFAAGQWAAARAAYDAARRVAADPRGADAWKAARQAAVCALRLGDWEDALLGLRGTEGLPPVQFNHGRSVPESIARLDEARLVQRVTERLEDRRALAIQLAEALAARPDLATAWRRRIAAADQVAADFALVDHLLGEGFDMKYPTFPPRESWWAERSLASLPAAEQETEFARQWQRDYEGIPADAAGRPQFLAAPADYRPDLGRGRKVLYLLREIERLDPTPTHEHAAQALIRRAHVCRVLYGPLTDPYWEGGVLPYRFFGILGQPGAAAWNGPGKPPWDLADDETRTRIGGRVRMLQLPPDESPLALLRRVEATYPRAAAAAEAAYLRGVFYQARQQFAKALAEYDALRRSYPTHPRAEDAARQSKLLREGVVYFAQPGVVHPADSRPQLTFLHRMTDLITFTARPVDLRRYVHDFSRTGAGFSSMGYAGPGAILEEDARRHHRRFRQRGYLPYLGAPVARWTEAVARSERVAGQTTTVPLSALGAYLVEARPAGGGDPTQALVILTDIALAFKPLDGRVLLYAADARTGRPLADQEVTVFAPPPDQKGHSSKSYNHPKRGHIVEYGQPPWPATRYFADAQGVIELPVKPGAYYRREALAISPRGGIALIALYSHGPNGLVVDRAAHYLITDRPAYRPGDTVHVRYWARGLDGQRFRPPAADQPLDLHVTAPPNRNIQRLDLRTDRWGAVTASFTLPRDAALGTYTVHLGRGQEVGTFAVEAYRKPEFAVTVRPAAEGPALLGGKVAVRVEARYLFGRPVAGATVHYRVRSAEQPASFTLPRPFDWLYGPGYGHYADEADRQPRYYWESLGNGDADGPAVLAGETRLDQNGVAEIVIDTAALPAEGADCLRLTVEAEVRDDSRRTVQGKGQVVVSRPALGVVVEADRAWYRPGDAVTVEAALHLPGGAGVAAAGTLRLERLTAADPEPSPVRQDVLASWPLKTDARGRLTHRLTAPAEGHYRLVFQASNAQDKEATGACAFWVHGPGLEAKRCRLPALAILPDRPSYRVGDTARLLLLTSQANARVFFSAAVGPQGVKDYRFLDVADHALVVEVPIEAKHVPNLFTQAFVVSRAQVHTARAELFVPPQDGLLTVRLESDKAVYRPGEAGTIRVRVTDHQGRPVAGQVTLAAYDQAVTAIREESEPHPRILHAARRMRASDWDQAYTHYSGWGTPGGYLPSPQYEIYDGGITVMGIGGGGFGGPPGAQPAPLRSLGEGPAAPRAGPVIRDPTADTAVWRAVVELSPDGTAAVPVTWPQALTTWRVRAYALTVAAQVGDATAEIITRKDLLVRLQTPRFLVEGDEAVLSANVHNDLPAARKVRVELEVPGDLLALAGPATAEAEIPAGATRRFDWPVRALRAGAARVVVRAVAADDGDGVQSTVPILAHGTPHREGHVGSLRADEAGPKTVTLTVPATVDPRQTLLEVDVSPGPVGPMLDALPFLGGYPYGCTEQTLSRFYPTVLAAATLKKLGIDLEAVAKRPPAERPAWADRFGPGPAPVADSAALARMAQAGLDRLTTFQHPDGGWGWWQGDASSPYLTAYVLLGLHTARQAGVAVSARITEPGYAFLLTHLGAAPAAGTKPEELQTKAMLAYVLASGQPRHWEFYGGLNGQPTNQGRLLLTALAVKRARLNPYGQALVALALHHTGQADEAKAALRDLLAHAKKDDANGSAWIPTTDPEWWRWWNSDVETNAWALRALLAIEPNHELAPRLAQGLIDHRDSGRHWRSTRDTALAVTALADFLTARPAEGETRVTVAVDGKPVREVAFTAANYLTTAARVRLEGAAVGPGPHQVTVTRQGGGPLFFACQLHYFSRDLPLRAEGTGLGLQRQYFRLPRPGQAGERVPLRDGDGVAVGDVIEVDLTVTAEAAYEFLAFEDVKPAGGEPVQVQSGGSWIGGHWTQLEFRDDRVLFFLPSLERGERVLRYQLRAEAPGTFHALPARGFAMYAPAIQARSAEQRLRVAGEGP